MTRRSAVIAARCAVLWLALLCSACASLSDRQRDRAAGIAAGARSTVIECEQADACALSSPLYDLASDKIHRQMMAALNNGCSGQTELLVAGETPMGFKAIINNRHWGLIHKNEVFKFLRSGMHEKGFIKEVRQDGKISLSLQPVGAALADTLQEQIMARLEAEGGVLGVCDKSDPALISKLFNVSKGNFKKAIGALFKQGRIVIHDDRIERA